MKDHIERIITNFREQQQAYLRMADMAQAQLAWLQQTQPPVETNELTDLLQARQDLIQEIDVLNSHNKFLQEQVTIQLDLSEFVLSRLESKLAEVQYKSLCEAVAGLSNILAKINKTDEQNQILIKKKAGPDRANPPANRQNAQDAYHQAVQQGKR